jgi:hypothetical protein
MRTSNLYDDFLISRIERHERIQRVFLKFLGEMSHEERNKVAKLIRRQMFST